MKPSINTATTLSIQKKEAEPYEKIEDWFQSQKDISDSEDLYSSIHSYKRSDTSHYERIEFDQLARACQKLSNTQSLQTNPQTEYITILADTEGDNYTSGITRCHSDTHISSHYTGENNYTATSDVSIESDCLQPIANGQFFHSSLPHIPGYQDDSIPPVDVSPSQEPSSLHTPFVPMYEELHPEKWQTDVTSVDNESINDINHRDDQFIPIWEKVDTSPVVRLSTTYDTMLQCKPCLSRSCSSIPDTISDKPKQTQPKSSLDIPSCSDDNQLRVRSHSIDTLAELNQEVYSFVANSLHPERKENRQPSLNEIFGRYCQNEKLVSLDSKMLSSECISPQSSSDNGTASLTQQ